MVFLLEEQIKLQQILNRFTLDNIYNINEMILYRLLFFYLLILQFLVNKLKLLFFKIKRLFYWMAPNQMLSTKPVYDQKKDKTQVTVLLNINAT